MTNKYALSATLLIWNVPWNIFPPQKWYIGCKDQIWAVTLARVSIKGIPPVFESWYKTQFQNHDLKSLDFCLNIKTQDLRVSLITSIYLSKWQWFTQKKPLKMRKIKFKKKNCGYLGPLSYVSMRKRGTCYIAPKLRGAHFKGSKTF